MKTKMLIAVIAALCLVTFSSCNSAEMTIQKEVTLANKQCPLSMGSGLTMVSVEFPGLYVVYNIKGDDEMYSFSKDIVTDEMKEQLSNELKAKAMSDKNVDKFVNALKEKHVGIIYHYFTDSSVMDVVIEADRF